ncbi:tyrosine-protein phosphatase [Colwellia sp. MEBiC06753]
MYDLHSHILPAIDDGAQSIDDTVALLTAAVKDDISHLICTPHIQLGRFDNSLSSIGQVFEQVSQHPAVKALPITLSYAAEVRICPEIMLLAKQQKLPFVGHWQQMDVLLLELPHSHIPPGTEQLIKWLINHNIMPMLAHPERNRDIQADYNKFNLLAKSGCLFQLTASSIIGDFGELAQKVATRIIAQEKATIVASDCHNIKRRPPKMSEAFNYVSRHFSSTQAELLFKQTPKQIAERKFHG